MKVTLLGHASVVVELAEVTCLMDPVFTDPFEEGAVVSCPKRSVYPDRLPPVDILIVSHRHPDHFDIPSLAQVPRDCDAICPADPLIVYALDKLGFPRLHPVHTMGEIRSADFELFPTRSEVTSVREFGMVFRDVSGTFWNQVDSFPSGRTIEAIKQRFGDIDLLFAMYASQNFEFFENRATDFPFEAHRVNLENVLRIRPRMIAPGAAGFRFCGEHAWLNAFLFPIARERFVADLQRLAPEILTQIMNPGDVFEITRDDIHYAPAASDVARLVNDDTQLSRFNPTAPIPDLTDPNPEGYPAANLRLATERFVAENIANYVDAGYTHSDPLINRYRQHEASYAVAIVFPDGATHWYRFEFRREGLRLITGESADSADSAADIVHRIAASALVGWLEYKNSFFYVRAYSRRYTTLYELSRQGERVGIRPVLLPDLLMHYLLNVAEGSEVAAKHYVDLQIQAVSKRESPGRGSA